MISLPGEWQYLDLANIITPFRYNCVLPCLSQVQLSGSVQMYSLRFLVTASELTDFRLSLLW